MLGFSSLLISCQSKKKEIPSVDHFFQLKVEKARLDRIKECKGNAIVEAEKQVDQLIDRWIKDHVADTINFPRKPARPKSPGHLLEKSN